MTDSQFQQDESSEQVKTKPRNFLMLIVYQVIVRCGWIFKTESVVMPAVMQMLGAPAWMRGCLTTINRFGQSVPPLVISSRIRVARQKKRIILVATSTMGGCFITLGLFWNELAESNPIAMQGIFLVIYTIFFFATGINQLAVGTAQGKLIEAEHRGRLLTGANFVGALSAAALVLLLMPKWLNETTEDFTSIFLFTGSCFVAASLLVLLLDEKVDHYERENNAVRESFKRALKIIKTDARFRRIALVGALFSSSIMLFPHYQPMAQDVLDMDIANIGIWIVVQNIGVAGFSLILGPLADSRGNRFVLRVLLFGVLLTPIVALVLANQESGGRLFWIVFTMIGLTPVTIRILQNYTLELVGPSDQPHYLGTLSLCVAGPAMLSPLFAGSIDLFDSYVPLFVGICVLLLIGWILTFTLTEPRHE